MSIVLYFHCTVNDLTANYKDTITCPFKEEYTMIRKIIHINKEKCNGCGACAAACHEGAISMINGKAQLMRDDYCDGLGDCLPHCPTNAITFEEREALPYDEAAVETHKKNRSPSHAGGCPGSQIRTMCPGQSSQSLQTHTPAPTGHNTTTSQLRQWPVQIRLVPASAPYFADAHLLIAADCTAYAYARFHDEFIHNKITLIGCPKLDDIDYADKLTEIIRRNNIKDVTIVRMEVPCCGGLEQAAKKALQQSGKFIPWQVVTITIDGKIKED